MANRDPQEAVDLVVAACNEFGDKFNALFAQGPDAIDIAQMINDFYCALGEAIDPEGMAARRDDEAARKERQRRVLEELLSGE